MASVTRLFPEHKLQALRDFKTSFPEEFATLTGFTDLAKGEEEFQASFCGMNSMIIFISILNILEKERKTISDLNEAMKTTRIHEVNFIR